MTRQLYPENIIRQMLQSNIMTTINMASLDTDPDIIRARIGVICELAELFGLSDQLTIPSVTVALLKTKAIKALDVMTR